MVVTREANLSDLVQVATLFDQYRIFYRKDSDMAGARNFLKARMEGQESTIIVACLEDRIVGFTQLFPIFSSTRMGPIYLLNDLFVHKDYRKHGIGQALIERVQLTCMQENKLGFMLETESDNTIAQGLYEKMGLIRNRNFFYEWNS